MRLGVAIDPAGLQRPGTLNATAGVAPGPRPRLLSFFQRRTVTTTPTPECHGHTYHQPSQDFDPAG